MEKNRSKYKSLNEWRKAKPNDYNSAYNQGVLPKICEHFGWKTNNGVGRNYWSKERCMEEARKYDSRKDWKRGSKGSYNASQRNGWIDECSKHMKIWDSKKLIFK